MSIRKRNGKWNAHVYAGMENGKRVYIDSPCYNKKSDAVTDEVRIKKTIYDRNHVVRSEESFISIGDLYFKLRKPKVTSITYTVEYEKYESILIPAFGSKLVSEIKKQNILLFLSDLETKYSPETVHKYFGILKRIMDFSVECDLLDVNPCAGVKLPKIIRKKKETWSEDEIATFLNLDDTKNQSCYAAFLILFTTGMRPGEVCGLRWCDLHCDHFAPTYGIDLHHNVTNLKNEKAHDKVYIAPQVQIFLKKLKTAQKELYLSFGIPFSESNFINVLTPDMRCINADYLRKQFDKIVTRNNLKKIRLYDARHSLGTNMMRAGINPKEVAEVMRHTSVKTTLDIYSHVDDDEKRSVMNNYSSKIFG